MILAAVLVSFILGAMVTLVTQWLFARQWFYKQPCLLPPYREQHHKIELPKPLSQNLSDGKKRGSTRDSGAPSETSSPSLDRASDQGLILNILTHFLFNELKDTARVRRWMARKLNVEFEEMLTSTTGKFMNQIQVRDFSFGSCFPTVKAVELISVEMDKEKDFIKKADIALDIDYEGGFRLTLDVDIIFGAWAYLSILVTQLSGRARLQMSRTPTTHWSFSFYDDPRMDFEVDSRFNGRPIPQISSLIINQIKRTIRKKHVLPSYKMRYKPLFIKPEVSFVEHDICFRGNRLGRGKLSVKVLRCSRLQELDRNSKLYCTLSVDKESMEDVWKQSWRALTITLKPTTNHGLSLKEQLSGDKTEKKRVVIDSVLPASPAAEAGLCRGDIIEFICNVRVLSVKHANKQIKLASDLLTFAVKRHQSRMSLEADQQFLDSESLTDLEFEIKDSDLDNNDDAGDFININLKESPKVSNNSSNSNTNAVDNVAMPSKPESQKLSEKLGRKIQSGKRKLLGMRGNGQSHEGDRNTGNSVDSKGVAIDEDIGSGTNFGTSPSAGEIRNGSQSAKSSPLKQVKVDKRQRAFSDTSLNRQNLDGDSGSVSSDAGSYGNHLQELRAGEISTRELEFGTDPEWNEEFEFACTDEDRYVNVCVWCRLLQVGRATKQPIERMKDPELVKQTPPTDELPYYNVTTKIGYVSIPLSDIVAGCLLTLQGDTQYTIYLHPPEETITATRAKVAYASHAGFDRTICQGDITLSFAHQPFKEVEKKERRKIINNVLNPPPQRLRAMSVPLVSREGQHKFIICQFPSGTYCQFCGKKIWLKGGLQCRTCKMICHKKCVDKCNTQTKCTKEGPKIASRPNEPWVAPVRGGTSSGDQDREEKEGKQTVGHRGGKLAGGQSAATKFFKGLRPKEQQSLPLNIPYSKSQQGHVGSSQSHSPMGSPSPYSMGGDGGDGKLKVSSIRKNTSAKSLSDRGEDDSDEDLATRYRHSNYSLDDNIVIEAKEKGKELYSNLSLPERKKTLDEMVTKLQSQIDNDSEFKAELLKALDESGETEVKRRLSQQLDKCDEKMEALMMMMVHYCAGLQHCLDQEEAHKRLLSMTDETVAEDEIDESEESLASPMAPTDGGIEIVEEGETLTISPSAEVSASPGPGLSAPPRVGPDAEDMGIQFMITETD
ncbi:PDZ domain-containing protein 8-like [Mya arenaria]|uniref:PDZ domain-containing protein 8-like n=1 Tax=Mya arenaria TaxID=6604 RepID=UPI0022DFEA0F|nr:PDZ domain-containing protein 8-like [Mya arenaria]XP_052793410.1 PDZ domain-containing protein 8-like [Mya arenaria]